MNPSPLKARRPAVPGRPTKVLQIIGNAIVGGMETWVLRMVQTLPREQFEFTALCPFESPFTDRLRALRVAVHVTPMPDDPPWSTVQMTAALAQQMQADLLHAHLPRAHLLAGLVGALTRKPVLTTIHGRQLTTLDLEVHRLAQSHVSVVCQHSYFHALGLGVDPQRLSCEPNGVDTFAFSPQGEGAGLRAALGLAAGTPLVGFVGRLSPEKGPEVLVRAMLMLAGRRPDAHAVFVGEGPMADELHCLATRLRVQDRVHWLGCRTDMAAVLRDLDVLVSCSHSEAMPLALMEGMACGLPAVATRVGGVPDLVAHGHSGFLVAPGDFEDIAHRVADVLDDAELHARMARCARERCVRQLDLAPSVARVGALMRRLARPLRTVSLAAGQAPARAAADGALPRPAPAAASGPSGSSSPTGPTGSSSPTLPLTPALLRASTAQ